MKTILILIELLTGIALIIAILLHSPKGEGLGGIGGQARIFQSHQKGIEAGLNKFTYALVAIFMTIATVLGLFY